MKVAVLGSGSRGNAILVVSGETLLLVDVGFSAREVEQRLSSLAVSATSITAVVITHDHSDHTKGMGVFARRHGTPLHLTPPTLEACRRLLRGSEQVRAYRPGFPFDVGPLRVEPFLTAHDARDPVAVAIHERPSGLKLGIATDLGRPTTQVRHALSGCDLLILEANHDPQLLHSSSYPPAVRNRIASSHGHLSNDAAAQLAVDLMHPRLGGVVLAHLSKECNDPELARTVVGEALARAGYRGMLTVADQETPTDLFDVGQLRPEMQAEQLGLLEGF